MTAALHVNDISLRLPDCALCDICLDVAPGECLCVMGPTGAGKTVLVEIIAGIRQPDHGQVWLDGHEVTRLPAWARGIAYVPQDAVLFPHLSVEGNIAYGLLERRLPPDRISARAAEAAAAVGVGHLLHRSPCTLSGGEAQRVALARALALDASLVLLDEPFAAVDERNRERLSVRVRDLERQRGAAVMYVSHSLEEATAIGDRICVLDAGRVAQIATPDELLRRPRCEFVATFTGARNILCGTVLGTDGQRHFVTGSLRLPVVTDHQGPARLMIRPEDIRLLPAESAPQIPRVLAGRVKRVAGAGALIRIEVTTADVDWVVLVTPRELKAMNWGMAEGLAIAVDLPTEALHVIPADPSGRVDNTARPKPV